MWFKKKGMTVKTRDGREVPLLVKPNDEVHAKKLKADGWVKATEKDLALFSEGSEEGKSEEEEVKEDEQEDGGETDA